MLDNDGLNLSPIGFFSLSVDCYRRPTDTKGRLGPKFRLPDTAALTSEESFARVALAWSDEGIYADVDIGKPFEEAFYPDVQSGDSVELFVDTRDIKSSGFNTRFCHHFYFLGAAVEGRQAGEMTRFRTEDIHEWCDAAELKVKAHLDKRNYALAIFIPAHCLHGYDPEQFDRLGFTYRINRLTGLPQHFSVVTSDFPVDQQPSLWASLRLIK